MGYMGSSYNIPEAIFYLLKGDYRVIQKLTVYIVISISLGEWMMMDSGPQLSPSWLANSVFDFGFVAEYTLEHIKTLYHLRCAPFVHDVQGSGWTRS